MKVIIIKECKHGKVNDVIEVSDGFAKNYLIKNGFAIPIKHSTNSMLSKKMENIEKQNEEELNQAKTLKKKIEDTILEFKLKTSNNIVHGSITNKQIIKQLKEKDIIISKYALGHTEIKSIGTTKITAKIHKQVSADITIKVGENE